MKLPFLAPLNAAIAPLRPRLPLLCIPSRPKEIHFFDQNGDCAKGLRWYLAHFPLRPLRNKVRIVFETRPSYLFFAEKPAPRIKAYMQEATCIAILRDAVKRPFTAWNLFWDLKDSPKQGHLHNPRSFAQAVEDELAGRSGPSRHKYQARGHDAAQLTPIKEFFPTDLLLVYNHGELKRQPLALANKVRRRLGLPPVPDDLAVSKARAHLRSYSEKLNSGLAKELYRYFKPEMAKLRHVPGYELNRLERP